MAIENLEIAERRMENVCHSWNWHLCPSNMWYINQHDMKIMNFIEQANALLIFCFMPANMRMAICSRCASRWNSWESKTVGHGKRWNVARFNMLVISKPSRNGWFSHGKLWENRWNPAICRSRRFAFLGQGAGLAEWCLVDQEPWRSGCIPWDLGVLPSNPSPKRWDCRPEKLGKDERKPKKNRLNSLEFLPFPILAPIDSLRSQF